jgi:hypothetical protein
VHSTKMNEINVYAAEKTWIGKCERSSTKETRHDAQ